MAGLPVKELITAAIVVVVVLVSLKAGSGIAHAADKIADITGIPLGTPSIKSFTATPDGEGNMKFQLSLAHTASDVGLQIYQLYTPTPDNELGTPDFKEENMVFNLIPGSEDTGQKLEAEFREKGIIIRSCPKEYNKGEHGCFSSSAKYDKPGGYKFVAVLIKGGKEVDNRAVVASFYDEDYVEMLQTPVFGCKDEFRDCNVIECKKLLINRIPKNIPMALRKNSGLLLTISQEFRKERNFDNSNKCGKVTADATGENVIGNQNNAFFFVIGGCKPDDIDALNIKVARARLLETAHIEKQLVSEQQYMNNLDRLNAWLNTAVKATMACTKHSSLSGSPKGAYDALNALGWVAAPGESLKKKETEIGKELANKLSVYREQADYIITAPAISIATDKSLALTWKASNEGFRNGYEVKHSVEPCPAVPVARTMSPETFSRIEELGTDRISDPAATSYSTTPGQTSKCGTHSLNLMPIKSDGTTATGAVQSMKLFDERYLDVHSYFGGKLSLYSIPDNPQNKDAIGSAKNLWLSSGVDTSKCVFKQVSGSFEGMGGNYWEVVGCSPDDLDKLFVAKLKSVHPADWEKYYKCERNYPFNSRFGTYCDSKYKLMKKMKADGYVCVDPICA